MKLILRKNDSATSLLLFIYNIYIAKNSKESIKLSILLEILKVFGKSETAIRMSLSRAIKAGLLINNKSDNEVSYALTAEGKKAIIHWNEGVTHFFKRYQQRSSQWDNKWYFVNVEFTEENKAIKSEFLDKLQQRGFAQINTNTWVTPYYQYEDVWELIREYSLSDSIVEIHGEMKIHKDINKFLNDIYGIVDLKAAYQGFIGTYSSKLQEIRELCKEPNFIENGLAFPILHGLGFSFFDIAADDAVLPRQLLPEWEGDEAALLMRELRGLLLESTHKYLEKFNK